VNVEGFHADVLKEPEALERVAAAYARGALLPEIGERRVLMLGMGSSAYAAQTAAAVLRSRGVDACVELASTSMPQPPGRDTLVLAISASGGSEETLAAMSRHRGVSEVVAVTNEAESAIAGAADSVLPVLAGPEEGGIACRSYVCTLAVLLLLAGAEATAVGRAAVASSRLIAARDEWLPQLADLMDGGAGVWVAAPAERIGSALQAALMLREAPRIVADGCETGDWLHVDVYLTKRPGYRLLLLPGSPHDAGVIEWRRERGFEVVCAGREVEGCSMTVPIEGAGDHLTASLTETVVAELLAAELWRRHPI
jgi:glutamine---fructose-6-phosphate transaminase (isomerizing)